MSSGGEGGFGGVGDKIDEYFETDRFRSPGTAADNLFQAGTNLGTSGLGYARKGAAYAHGLGTSAIDQWNTASLEKIGDFVTRRVPSNLSHALIGPDWQELSASTPERPPKITPVEEVEEEPSSNQYLVSDGRDFATTALSYSFGHCQDPRQDRPCKKWHKSPEDGRYDYITTTAEFNALKRLYKYEQTDITLVCSPQIIDYTKPLWDVGRWGYDDIDADDSVEDPDDLDYTPPLDYDSNTDDDIVWRKGKSTVYVDNTEGVMDPTCWNPYSPAEVFKPDFLTIQGHLRDFLKHSKSREGPNKWFYDDIKAYQGNALLKRQTNKPITVNDGKYNETGCEKFIVDNDALDEVVRAEEEEVFKLLDTWFFIADAGKKKQFRIGGTNQVRFWDWNDVLFGNLDQNSKLLKPRVEVMTNKGPHFRQYVDPPTIVWRWFQGCRFEHDAFGRFGPKARMLQFKVQAAKFAADSNIEDSGNVWCEIDMSKVAKILSIEFDVEATAETKTLLQRRAAARQKLLNHGINLAYDSTNTRMGKLRDAMDPAYATSSMRTNLVRMLLATDKFKLDVLDYGDFGDFGFTGNKSWTTGRRLAVAGTALAALHNGFTTDGLLWTAGTSAVAGLTEYYQIIDTGLEKVPGIHFVDPQMVVLGCSLGLFHSGNAETVAGYINIAKNAMLNKVFNEHG